METKEVNGKFYQRKKLRFYSYPMWMEVPAPDNQDITEDKDNATKKANFVNNKDNVLLTKTRNNGAKKKTKKNTKKED